MKKIILSTIVAVLAFGGLLHAAEDKETVQINAALPDKPTVKPSKKHKILVYSKHSGFRHGSIPIGIKALRAMGEKTGAFEAKNTYETTEFTTEGLKKYDAIIFNNTTHVENTFSEQAQRDAILNFIKDGKAFAGFHSASDGGMTKWPEYTDMIGGCFDGHPWGAGGKWTFEVEDSGHAVSQAFKEREFEYSDEIYQYKGYDRSKLRVLVSLNEQKCLRKGKDGKLFPILGKRKDNDNPVSWVRDYGKGRIFYSNFGHNKATWMNAAMLQHFLDGIQWALGDLEGPSESLPKK